MTRMANEAQRSGAAMLSLVFTRPREDYSAPSRILSSFFFCVSPTLARWHQGQLWAEWSGESSPGSLVLNGTGGRTAKRLKFNGSVVLFRTLTRDACADACLCARIREDQKHGFTEPKGFILIFQSFSGSLGVLYRFCSGSDRTTPSAAVATASIGTGQASAVRIKISGGYAARIVAASIRSYPGLEGGSARAKFRAGTRAAGCLTAPMAGAIEVGAAVGRNGGNPPFFGASSGRVGTPMLERGQETAENRAFAVVVQQPARFAAGRLGAAVNPRGVGADRPGGTPPSPPRALPRSWPQPIFQVSADLEIRRVMPVVSDRDGRLCSKPQMGSGVVGFSAASDDRGERALDRGQQDRIGEQGAFSSWGRSLETTTLWGGLQRVN